MSGRAGKVSKLRSHVEIAVERWARSERKNGRRVTPEDKRRMRKDFEKSAMRIDKTKLHEVWN